MNRDFFDGNYEKVGNIFETMKSQNVKEYTEELFLNELEKQIRKLENLKLRIDGNSIEEKELKKSVNEVLEIYKDLRDNKENLLQIIIPMDKRLIMDKDYDGDGLTNRQELYYGTDPWDKDTDKDGKSDYEEIFEK
ncbi:hypothetical protein EII29_02415 [Leptotrichia sp. OH3620_COT-345]|uniref:hypothetical protein n=1 Tax=Leptotrichia sp. OH3620_COT-345 TaxID=2491048 RepID=UPI000F64B94D|nr:hypothetical protein [Leptotrichia sp. OH3620_COT-345]RRD40352.1 hypothetical protein EII29_02415 [Leptotrichia sp. OH3620_COT-345]